MSLDLTLIPVDHEGGGFSFGHSLLQCARDALFDAIEAMGDEPLPANFSGFLGTGPDGEHGYAEMTKSPYGSPLRCVRAGALCKLRWPTTGKNAAVRAYLGAMPADTKIVLFWH